MILGFAADGASGMAVGDYLVRERARDTAPEVLRGDPARTAEIIDALSFEYGPPLPLRSTQKRRSG